MSIKKTVGRLWTRSPQELVARFKRRLSKEELAEADPGTGGDSRSYVWCLSTGRVGTKTLAALAELGQGLDSHHEPKPLLYGLARLGYELGEKEECRKILEEAVRACRPLASVMRSDTYIETSPQTTFLAPALREVFPNSRFVHIIRHPGAVIRSGMRRAWYQGHCCDKWRIVPVAGEAAEKWKSWDALEKNVWLWAETNRWIESFMDGLDAGSTLTLKCEDLISGEKESLEKWFRFLGSDVPAENRISHVLGRRLNQQQTGNFPRVEDWSDEMREVLVRDAGSLMERFGYEI